MFIKLIKIGTTPDRRGRFLECQRLWNEAMSRCDGFVDAVVASDTAHQTDIYILVIWRDRESLERFMRDVHDKVEAASGIRGSYDSIAVAHLDVEDDLLPSGAGHLLFGTGAQGIVALSEAYRASAILRSAVACGFFDAIGGQTYTPAELAATLKAPESVVYRLAQALAALGLAVIEAGRITLTETSRRYLCRGDPHYLGHLVLHNTRPALWERWGKLKALLKLDYAAPDLPDHQIFISAMGDVACAGQARQLVERVDLSDRSRLLDIGGAGGDYAIALAENYPSLSADILDLADTQAEALARMGRSAAAERLHFVVGDYRQTLPQGPYDVVLLSNILRGECEAHAVALVKHVAEVLENGGLLIVQDLFPDTTAGLSGLLASFFSLHLPDALNPSSSTVVSMLQAVGFRNIDIKLLDTPLIANKLITAVASGKTAE